MLGGHCIHGRYRAASDPSAGCRPAPPGHGHAPNVREALILAAGRTPFGARHGALAGRHPADLLAATLDACLERGGVDPSEVDEVVVGCATPVGAQAANLGARAVRASGRLAEPPASVISTQDTSSLLALIRAVDAVRSGRCGTVLVGGVESMSTVPAGADMTHRGFGLPAPPDDAGLSLPPGPATEAWATRNGVDRDRLESVAERSRERAKRAQTEGRFAPEILTSEPGALSEDELICSDAGVGRTAVGPGAPGLYSEDGLLTASTVAPMADGAAAAVVVSEEVAVRCGVEPVARVAAVAASGGDPRAGRGASLEASARVLATAGLRHDRVGRVELAEPFATSIVRWQLVAPDLAGNINPYGGSLALGHPQGATGLGLVARLVGSAEGAYGVAACDATDGHGAAVLLGA